MRSAFTANIKTKLQLSFLFLIVLSVLGGVISYRLLKGVQSYQITKDQISQLVLDLSEARKAEKDVLLYDRKTVDFLEDGESRNVQLHAEKIASIFATLKTLKRNEVLAKLGLQEDLIRINRAARGYQATFEKLVGQMHRRGFKDHGLEGEMRDFVHALQKGISAEEQVFAFKLRRHEKDFFLRLDPKYVDRLHATTEEFLAYLAKRPHPHMTDEYLYRFTNGIMAYRHHFNKIADVDFAIGLDDNSGLRGELKVRAGVIEPLIDGLYATINDRCDMLKARAFFVMIISSIVLLLAGLLMAFILSGAIARPIILLDSVIKSIMGGKEDAVQELDAMQQKGEIGSLLANFKKLLTQVKANMALVTEKNQTLENAKEADTIRNWSMEGLALFGDLLKRTDDLEKTSQRFVAELINYLQAKQGGLYLTSGFQDEDNKHEERLRMVACYAWGRKKKVVQEYRKGEGLVGATWLDQETRYYTDIPEGYAKIRSGLGEASPKTLLFVPIMSEGETIGLIEIASFQILEEYQIAFVEELADRVGASLMAVRMQERTKTLLRDSQQLTEELQANEEEIRQNMEEMQATQEEVARKTSEMEEAVNKAFALSDGYSAVLNQVFKGVMVCDEQFSVNLVSLPLVQRLAYCEEEIKNQHIQEFFTIDLAEAFRTLDNDPQFIIHGVSDVHKTQVFNRMGVKFDAKVQFTRYEIESVRYYSVLFAEIGRHKPAVSLHNEDGAKKQGPSTGAQTGNVILK